MRIEIFKSGTQTDSAGNSREWTETDLDKIATSYNPSNHEAHVVIGHPKDNAPAWGWVKSVTREGKSLFAEIGDLVPEFSDMLGLKMFKKRSISLYPDLSLRHIGFLGAMPPAVKGLADFKFSESESIEYADWDTAWSLNSVGRIFQNLRDWLIKTKDIATADSIISQNEIDSLKAMRATAESSSYNEIEIEENDMEKTKELEAQVASFSEKANAETTRANAAEARATIAENKLAEIKKESLKNELVQFADKMVSDGKLLPAQKENALLVMESLSSAPEMEFTEAGTTVKKTPLKLYQEGLEKSEKLISFGEIAVNGKSQGDLGDAIQISEKATAFKEQKARDGIEITISQAVDHVTKAQ